MLHLSKRIYVVSVFLFLLVSLHAQGENNETKEVTISNSYRDEADILLNKGGYLNLSKRLSINNVDPSIRISPDDSPIMDKFVSCRARGDEGDMSDGVSWVMVWIDRDTGSLKASYPPNYHCSFNQNNAKREISDYLIIYYLDRDKKQCDGRQLTEYVNNAILLGSGVINISKNDALGAGAISRAINSTDFNWYQSTLSDMRKHDLFLKRSGCNSLMFGPSTSDITKLKRISSQIDGLLNQEMNTSGFITESDGLIR